MNLGTNYGLEHSPAWRMLVLESASTAFKMYNLCTGRRNSFLADARSVADLTTPSLLLLAQEANCHEKDGPHV